MNRKVVLRAVMPERKSVERNGSILVSVLSSLIFALCSSLAAEPVPPGASGDRPGNALLRLLGGVSPGASSEDSGNPYPDEFMADVEELSGCTIDTIVVEGCERTRPSAITREMVSKPGTKLDEKSLRRDVSYLRGLGYFASVRISAEQTGMESCRLIVSIKDRPRLFMLYPYPVVNYDFEKGISY